MSDDEFGDIPAHHQRAKARLSSSAYRHTYERSDFFLPNAFQQRVLDAMKSYKVICGRAGGQIGKSTVAAFIITQLTTGRWKLTTRKEPKLDRAYKFVCWVLSESGATTILGMQTRLLGAMNDPGSGMLPLRSIKKITGAHGVPGCVGDVEVAMENGDLAIIRFKQFAQGVAGLTSESVDLVVFDELPTGSDSERIWAESMQRTAATSGTVIIVATPGKQLSPVLIWFRENDGKDGVKLVTGTVDDADHIEPEQKADIAKRYMSISAATYRSKYLGEEFVAGGSALTFDLEDIVHERDVRSFGSATTWCIGLDLGHGSLAEKASKTAACLLAHDPQTKMTWVCWEWEARALPESIVAHIVELPHGRAPCCWGAAEKSTTGTGVESFAQMFERLGLTWGQVTSPIRTAAYISTRPSTRFSSSYRTAA
jgi:phage terminase large subunit-like protein